MSIFNRADELHRDVEEAEAALVAKKALLSQEYERLLSLHGVGPHEFRGGKVRIQQRGNTCFIRSVADKG